MKILIRLDSNSKNYLPVLVNPKHYKLRFSIQKIFKEDKKISSKENKISNNSEKKKVISNDS